MLRSIIAAVVSALRLFGRLVRRVATAPFVMLDSMVGGGGAAPLEIPEVAPPEALVPKPVDNARFYEDLANAVMSWCADSIIRDAPATVPSSLPLAVKNWLPGLTREECDAIIEADKAAVSVHLEGMFELPGVRPVQALTPLRAWPPAPKPVMAPDTEDLRLSPRVTSSLDFQLTSEVGDGSVAIGDGVHRDLELFELQGSEQLTEPQRAPQRVCGP
jgi:hypothetical protein